MLTPLGKSGLSSAKILRLGCRSRICLAENRISPRVLGESRVRIWLTAGTCPMLRRRVVSVACLLGECFSGVRWCAIACGLFATFSHTLPRNLEEWITHGAPAVPDASSDDDLDTRLDESCLKLYRGRHESGGLESACRPASHRR